MQIYYTDRDPFKCAANLPDQLTYKILTEVAQLMSSFLWNNNALAPMKKINQGKKFQEWIKANYANWIWLSLYGDALNYQYKLAYSQKQNCASLAHVNSCYHILLDYTLPCPSQWFASNRSKHNPPPFVPVKDFHSSYILGWNDNARVATKYKNYLNWKVNNWKREGKNKRLYSWTNRKQPDFIKWKTK